MIYLTHILIFAVFVLVGYFDDGSFSFFDIVGLILIGLCLGFYDRIQKFLESFTGPPS
jgi:membrane-bound acyltransferase YfiQ involved in biofilm formation